MAEKEPIIVIKKINVVAAGGHGGSWKVAFADFMTALMAFFLLMWLLGQSDEVKKNVSDYFSTPSIIEYNFSNYGVELTLEKLFLDLINEPLKVLQSFITPMDHTPNFMAMGSKNIMLAELADQLGDFASGADVSSDEMVFELPERHLFQGSTGQPGPQFVDIMERVRGLTTGLEDANIFIDSIVYRDSLVKDAETPRKVAEMRLDLVVSQIQATLEHPSADVFGKAEAFRGERGQDGRPKEGFIRFRIKQKDIKSDGTKPRKMGELFTGTSDQDNPYNNFVKRISERKQQKSP